MRAKHLMMLLALGLVLQVSSKAKSEELNLDFKLVNSTGYAIKELYISPTSVDEWGSNILEEHMKDGDTLKIKFHPKATATKWDIKIVWADDGKSVTWEGCKLTDIETITLHYDEKSGKTTATTE